MDRLQHHDVTVGPEIDVGSPIFSHGFRRPRVVEVDKKRKGKFINALFFRTNW